jgi:hypothetical protein
MPSIQPQRHRALAELDARIDQTERTLVRCRLDLQDRADRLQDTGRASAALRMIDERLGLLRESRRVLLTGPDGRAN